MYEDFVPWCQRSRVLRRHENGSFDAELEIGFKFLVESYVSHVEMEKPKYIKVIRFVPFFSSLISKWLLPIYCNQFLYFFEKSDLRHHLA